MSVRKLSKKAEADVQSLHEQIQLILSNHTIEVAVTAMAKSMVAVIGFAANTPEHADDLVDSLEHQLKRDIRANWDYIQSFRAQGAQVTGVKQ